MKKLVSLLVVAAMALSASAQSAMDIAKERQQLNAFNTKLLNEKPTKEAKKQAKQLEKEGWKVMVGEPSIERQINNSLLYEAEWTLDENGDQVKRYIPGQGAATAGTYNIAKAAATQAARTEVAASIKQRLVGAARQKLDNEQLSASQAQGMEKYVSRVESIVDATLENSIPVSSIYRTNKNGTVEVQVRIAYDRNALVKKMQKQLRKEMEDEGDELFDLIDQHMKGM